MPVTIVATSGSASANSFVTLAEATASLEGRLNTTTWDAATADTQNRALVEATRDISVKTYEGTRASSTQLLSWPRQWATDPDAPNGWYFDSGVIPQRIKDATIELAFQYVNAGTSDLAIADPNAGVTLKQVDVLVTEWDVYRRATGLARFPRVLDLLRPLLCGSGSSVPLIRG